MSMILTTLFPLALSGVPLVATPPAVPADIAPAAATADAAPARLYLAQAPVPPVAQAAAPSPAIDKAAIIDKAAAALTSVRTAEGKFEQIDNLGQLSSGVFYISRPGKVRFDYTSPEAMHIVSDGVSVSVEEPKRASYTAAPLASTPLHLFLRSNVDLQRDGSVTEVSASDGSYFVTLVDKTGEAQGSMTLQFRASDFQLMGWTTTTGTGEQTRVKLSDAKQNVSLKPSLFIVKDPADARDDRR
ncbi:MAG: hypothetical protein GC155_08140 [Alphaproteobacteria bacterium]|nr:hypothetical protein [Alphaproteobacteria bacterium]